MQAEGAFETVGLIDVDLADWPPELEEAAAHSRVQALIRWAGAPLATLEFDCDSGPLTPALIWRRANELLGDALIEAITRRLLEPAESPRVEEHLPSATVVICTRDRPDDLRRCLESLRASAAEPLEVVVVDNAPAKAPAEVEARSFGARYVLEPRAGLNRARQCGARAASGDVVIYIDDDVVVSPGWETALLSSFNNPEVAGATGLVLPLVLATRAQLLFEEQGGFSRGYERREHTLEFGSPLGAGLVGAGACMAFRRELVTELGLFAAEMDAGTPTFSGGDTYAFYRLLSLGYLLVYEPRTVVRHRHRSSMKELYRALYGYSVGTYCYLLRCLLYHGESSAVLVGVRWFRDHHIRHFARGLARRRGAQPLSLTVREIAGAFISPVAFVHAAIRERRG